MVSQRILQLLLSFTPAIGTALAGLAGQQLPLGLDSLDDFSADTAAPSYRSDLIALHKSLVSIPSTSGQEHEAGNFLVDYFASQGWNHEIQPVAPRNNTPSHKERFNVFAWPPSSHDAHPDPKVLVTSHIDCVPPHIPYSISDDEHPDKSTTISGRCSVDAKGSVAAQLTAVNTLLAAGTLQPEDVMVLYVVGEEVSGDGMRTFAAARAAAQEHEHASEKKTNKVPALPSLRAAVFGEPTENKLACGHKGGMRCDVTARGRAGHSGYPWLGKSATTTLMRGVLAIVDAEASLGASPRFGNTTVNVGMMEGGVALNVIPAHAAASLMVRVAVEPQATGHEIVRERMRALLKEVDEEALSLDCPGGAGVTVCDCEVDGTSCCWCWCWCARSLRVAIC